MPAVIAKFSPDGERRKTSAVKDFAWYQAQCEYSLCSTLSCAERWRKAVCDGRCKDCRWEKMEEEVKDFAWYQAQSEYSLCSTLSCAALWRKAGSDGRCKDCRWEKTEEEFDPPVVAPTRTNRWGRRRAEATPAAGGEASRALS